jgi:hypothetical protein
MKHKMTKKRKLTVSLGSILLFVAVGAIPSGLLLVAEPDGSSLGLSSELLNNSIFADYLIPGLFLLTVNGLGNLLASILCYFDRKSASTLGLLLGIFLVIWIIIQTIIIGIISIIQPIFLLIGLIEIMLSVIIRRTKK